MLKDKEESGSQQAGKKRRAAHGGGSAAAGGRRKTDLASFQRIPVKEDDADTAKKRRAHVSCLVQRSLIYQLWMISQGLSFWLAVKVAAGRYGAVIRRNRWAWARSLAGMTAFLLGVEDIVANFFCWVNWLVATVLNSISRFTVPVDSALNWLYSWSTSYCISNSSATLNLHAALLIEKLRYLGAFCLHLQQWVRTWRSTCGQGHRQVGPSVGMRSRFKDPTNGRRREGPRRRRSGLRGPERNVSVLRRTAPAAAAQPTEEPAEWPAARSQRRQWNRYILVERFRYSAGFVPDFAWSGTLCSWASLVPTAFASWI